MPCAPALAVIKQGSSAGETRLTARRIPREGPLRGCGLGAGGVARPAGVSAPGARPAGAQEGLPPRGGGAGAPSPLTAPAREFQFETQRREEAAAAAGCLGLERDQSPQRASPGGAVSG